MRRSAAEMISRRPRESPNERVVHMFILSSDIAYDETMMKRRSDFDIRKNNRGFGSQTRGQWAYRLTCLAFGSLRGHYVLRTTASEIKSYHRFQISDPNYLFIPVHIVYIVWTLLAASEAITASK